MNDREDPRLADAGQRKPISDALLRRALEKFGRWEMAPIPPTADDKLCAAQARQHRTPRTEEPRR